MKDNVVPGTKWEFNSEVAECFDDMLARSIPGYVDMRTNVTRIASKFLSETPVFSQEDSLFNSTDPSIAHRVADLGASRGGAISSLRKVSPDAQYYALEISEPMCDKMNEVFSGVTNVSVINNDLRALRLMDLTTLLGSRNKFSVVLSILTLQFTPIEYRQLFIRRIRESLCAAGAFIFVEKVLCEDSKVDELFVETYYDHKRENGYSDSDIADKRRSLEGVLVPMTESANIAMLKAEGFSRVECFFRNLNFCGWVALP